MDKDTIANAKKMGINISEITENLLNAITYDTFPITYDKIVKSYEIFISEIQKIVKKYDLAITIGMHQGIDEKVNEGPLIIEGIVLNGAGLYAVNAENGESIGRRVKIEEVLQDLDEPTTILEQLFNKLIEVTEKSQSRAQELNFALRLLQGLSIDTEKRK